MVSDHNSMISHQTPGQDPNPDQDPAVTARDLAEMLGVTTKTVAEFANRGVLARVGHGRYLLWASIGAYVTHLREAAAGRAAGGDDGLDLVRERALLARVQREGQDMKNEVLREELLPVADVGAMIDGMFGLSRARLRLLPATLAPRLVGLAGYAEARAALTDGVYDALNELAETEVVVVSPDDRPRRRGGGDDRRGRRRRPRFRRVR